MTAGPTVPHRLPRAAAAAMLATAVGAVAHLLGGGVVTAAGLVGALAGLLVPIWMLAGRERSFAVIAGVQLAGQQLAHAWLELSAGPDVLPHLRLPDDVSLYGHLAAATLVAGWLRAGERRLWAAARRAVQAVATWLRWARTRRGGAPPGLVVLAHVDTPPTHSGTVLRHVLVRRGPPLAA